MRSLASGTSAFLSARRPVALGAWLLVAVLGSFLLWPFNLPVRFFGESDYRAVSALEPVALTCLVGSAWAATPRMATWDAQGVGRVQSSAGFLCLCILATTTAIAAFFAQVGYHLPWSLADHAYLSAADFPLDTLSVAAYSRGTRVLALGAALLVAVALLGRVGGTVVTLLAYVGLLYLEAGGLVLGPVRTSRGVMTANALAAVALATIAVWTWSKTSGAGVLARRLDPRR